MTNEVFKQYDYSDSYFKPENPNPHHDLPIDESQSKYIKENLSTIVEDSTFEILQGEPVRSSLRDLALFYETQMHSPDKIPDIRILVKLANQIYSVAKVYSLEPEEQDDHGFGKDCEKYCSVFEKALEEGPEISAQTIKRLTAEIDIVISGCHNEASAYSVFFDSGESEGWNLLEAKMHWDGKGSLWKYYIENWENRVSEEREYFPHRS
jgi:hypothetical protein